MTVYRQALRYFVVGICANLGLYGLYLLITFSGAGHKITMTVLYWLGVLLTFIFNRNWTFSHQGRIPRAFIAYAGIYAFGYLINFAGLYFLVDRLGYRHEWVQGGLVFLVAAVLFMLQKFFVFKTEAR